MTAITKRTKAIMPVHLFGQVAKMEAINDIAAGSNIPVIEDAARHCLQFISLRSESQYLVRET